MAKLSVHEATMKRVRLNELKRELNTVRRELEEHAQACARERSGGRLGDHQRKVLTVLDAGYDETDWRAYTFNGLISVTSLDRAQVRRACKGLRRLGYAKLEIGLWDEDGAPWGAGYRITKEGHDWIEARIDRVEA
jgi:hypothetical protein